MANTQAHVVTVEVSHHVLKTPLPVVGEHVSARTTLISWKTCALVILILATICESRSPLRADVELKNGHVSALFRQAAACLTSPLAASPSKHPKYVKPMCYLEMGGVGRPVRFAHEHLLGSHVPRSSGRWSGRISGNVLFVFEKLWKPIADRAGFGKINREGLGDAYETLSITLFKIFLKLVEDHIWRDLRMWVRLVLAKEGLRGRTCSVCVRRIEEIILDRTRHQLALNGHAKESAKAHGADDGADEEDDAPPKRRARGGVAHERPAEVTPALKRHVQAVVRGDATAATTAASVPFMERDLVGDLEAAMTAAGCRRPDDVTPKAGLELVAPSREFAALPDATQAAATALAHRLFAALPFPYTRNGTGVAPMRLVVVLQVFREHRQAFREFLVRAELHAEPSGYRMPAAGLVAFCSAVLTFVRLPMHPVVMPGWLHRFNMESRCQRTTSTRCLACRGPTAPAAAATTRTTTRTTGTTTRTTTRKATRKAMPRRTHPTGRTRGSTPTVGSGSRCAGTVAA